MLGTDEMHVAGIIWFNSYSIWSLLHMYIWTYMYIKHHILQNILTVKIDDWYNSNLNDNTCNKIDVIYLSMNFFKYKLFSPFLKISV